MIIDVFHDTTCPWCRIGKKNLKDAIAQFDGEEVTVRYHTFFLNFQIPPEGEPFRSYMEAKGGGRIPLEGFFDAPRQAGAAAGLTFNFEKIEYAPNTLLSHRLIALTPEERKEALIDAIYRAYFEEGCNTGDLDVLVEIAANNGLDADEIRAQLLTDAARNEVIADAQQAHQIGITGVPFFIFNQKYALSGAHPASTLLNILEQVRDETVETAG